MARLDTDGRGDGLGSMGSLRANGQRIEISPFSVAAAAAAGMGGVVFAVFDGRRAPQLIRIAGRPSRSTAGREFPRPTELEEITLCSRQIYLLRRVLTLPDYL